MTTFQVIKKRFPAAQEVKVMPCYPEASIEGLWVILEDYEYRYHIQIRLSPEGYDSFLQFWSSDLIKLGDCFRPSHFYDEAKDFYEMAAKSGISL